MRRGKGNKSREIPIMRGLQGALRDYLSLRRSLVKESDVGALFLDRVGRRWKTASAQQFFKSLNRRLKGKVRHVHAQLFRHSIAVHLVRGGADIRFVQAFLGHESLDTTKIYLRRVPADLRKAYDMAMPDVAIEMGQGERGQGSDKLDNYVKQRDNARAGGFMGELPAFNRVGVLPSGEYEMTLEALRKSFLVTGPRSGYPTWDAPWRGLLVENLSILVRQLWQVGITEIFVDGSFVEDKDHPNDIDGYFVCGLLDLASGRLQRELNRLDPQKVWTWDPRLRRTFRGYPKKQLPMWHQYRVELYPHYGQGSGIVDEFGNELEFPAAFRRSRRDGRPRGIVKVGGGP